MFKIFVLLCAIGFPLWSQSLNPLTAVGASNSIPTWENGTGAAASAHSFQVNVYSPSTCTIKAQGSNDNVTFFDLNTAQTCTSNILMTITNSPVNYVRVNLVSYSGDANGASVKTVYTGSSYILGIGGGTASFAGLTGIYSDNASLNTAINGKLGTAANAATASALFATPTLCGTGNAPTGILANGNATGCATITNSGMTNPMTTLGDIIYENGTPAPARLPGNTVANDQVIISHGTGSVSAAPTLSNAPVLSAANFTNFPTLNQDTTGKSGALTNGGIACTDASGSGTTYTCSPATALTAYTVGTFYLTTFATDSSGAATMNVSGLGAKALVQNKNQVIHAHNIVAGHEYITVYDGTSFQIFGTGDTQGLAIVRCIDDGSTDATTCLQTYLTNYLAVFIPKANTYYKATAPLILQSNQHIIGEYKPSAGISGGIGCASTTAHCLWAANSSQGYYVSGATVTGSATQTCAVSFTGGGTATLALTGTNAVATGTAFTAVSGISGVPGPIAATLANGTATCSGTIVVWTITAQGSRNIRIENLYVSDQVRGTRTLGNGFELDGTGGAAAFTLEEISIYGFENGVDFMGGCCTSTLKQVRSDSALNDSFHEHGQASTGVTYESTYGDAPGNYCYYASIQNYSGYVHTSCDASGSDAYHIATADGGTSRGLTFDGAGTESPLGTGFFIDATNVGLHNVDATGILNGFFPINLSHAGDTSIIGGYLTTAGTYNINVAAAPAYGALSQSNTIVSPPYMSGASVGKINDTFSSIHSLSDGLGTVSANLVNLTKGANIASAATIAPLSAITHITGTTTINTITVPTVQTVSGTFTGCVVLIPDGLWSTGISGNINLATTAVVSKALTECYDGTKWYPSY